MKFCIEHGVFYFDGHTEIPAAAITVTDKEFQDLTTGRNTGKKNNSFRPKRKALPERR